MSTLTLTQRLKFMVRFGFSDGFCLLTVESVPLPLGNIVVCVFVTLHATFRSSPGYKMSVVLSMMMTVPLR